MEEKIRFCLGKEYELGVYLGLQFKNDTKGKKSNDGSGPSEISSPKFESIKEAVLFEKFLKEVYGEALYEYYVNDDGDEQKGNHFHISFYINGQYLADRERMLLALYLALAYRKLLTLHDSFRNTVKEWNEYILVKETNDRKYAVITMNSREGSKRYEIRLAEGSVVGDLAYLLIALAIYNELRAINDDTVKKVIEELNNEDSALLEEYIDFFNELSYKIVLKNTENAKEVLSKLQYFIKRIVEEEEVIIVEFKEIKEILEKIKEALDLLEEQQKEEFTIIYNALEAYAKNNMNRRELVKLVMENIEKYTSKAIKDRVVKDLVSLLFNYEL